LTPCSLSLRARHPLCSRAAHSTNSLREVLLDIYSRTSCSWRSLSPNFPENWKNMLLNAFLLTYVWNFVYSFQWKITRSEPPPPSLSVSLSFSLSPMCYILSLFSLDKSFVSLLQLRLHVLHYTSLARFTTQTLALQSCSQPRRFNVPLPLTRIIL